MTDPTPLYEALDALWDDYISVNGGSVGFMTYLATRLEAARRAAYQQGMSDSFQSDPDKAFHGVEDISPFITALRGTEG